MAYGKYLIQITLLIAIVHSLSGKINYSGLTETFTRNPDLLSSIKY